MIRVTLYDKAGTSLGMHMLPDALVHDGTPEVIGYNDKLYQRVGVGYSYHEAHFIILPYTRTRNRDAEEHPRPSGGD